VPAATFREWGRNACIDLSSGRLFDTEVHVLRRLLKGASIGDDKASQLTRRRYIISDFITRLKAIEKSEKEK
jgi:hypothetical protein